MNEQAIRDMARVAVDAGTVTQAQADQWVAADLAALQGQPTPFVSGAAPGDAGVHARAAELVRTGQMTQAQADAALAQFNAVPMPTDDVGAPAAAPPAAPPPLTASGAPDPFAGVDLPPGFGPPARPEDYRFDLFHADPLTLDQLKDVGATFHAAKMPPGIAHQVYGEIASMAAQRLDDVGLEALNARTMAQLRGLWGDATDAKINTARAFLQTLDKARPGVLHLLEASRAGSSPIVIRQLVEHAERMAAGRRK